MKNKTQCLELSGNGNRWVNHKYNFDNLGQALMSLFVLSSKDGWVNIMYQGLDAVGVDQQVLLPHAGSDFIFMVLAHRNNYLCSLLPNQRKTHGKPFKADTRAFLDTPST